MNFTQKQQDGLEESRATLKTRQELETTIQAALDKIGGNKHSDICRYLRDGDGYMHHFTLEKLKLKDPSSLLAEIKRYILDVSNPQEVPAKPRAARGSRSQHMRFTQEEIKRLTGYCLKENDMELIAKLTNDQTLKSLAQQLTKAILRGEATQEMWNAYYEVKKAQHAHASTREAAGSLEEFSTTTV